ncbi:hypothetical protein [Streptomyces sp. NPDC001292]|uniref:RraA family protein n=1 Tax=Streptomyces sp. NPDC001292 TaxID=3364558 RepID=UPI0036AA58A5
MPRGAVNVPVDIEGVCITPGDVLVGDEDGAVVVPRSQVEDIITTTQAAMEEEVDKWWDRRGQSLGAVQKLADAGYRIF